MVSMQWGGGCRACGARRAVVGSERVAESVQLVLLCKPGLFFLQGIKHGNDFVCFRFGGKKTLAYVLAGFFVAEAGGPHMQASP